MRYLPTLLAVLCFACGNDTLPPSPAMPPLSDLPLVPLPVEMSNTEGYLFLDTDKQYDHTGADAGAGNGTWGAALG